MVLAGNWWWWVRHGPLVLTNATAAQDDYRGCHATPNGNGEHEAHGLRSVRRHQIDECTNEVDLAYISARNARLSDSVPDCIYTFRVLHP